MGENTFRNFSQFILSRCFVVSLAVLVIFFGFYIYAYRIYFYKGENEKDGFRWDILEGEEIEVYLSQNPYVEAIINRLPEFQKKTGIKVNYYIIPEEYYFEKLSLGFKKFRSPDAFMLGPSYIWKYADKGYIQDLNTLLNQSEITDPQYDINDFYPSVINALKWDTISGHKTGSGGLWGVPLGFELYTLAYNKRIFKEKGLKPPDTMEQLLELCEELNEFDGKGTYALALRGSDNWSTITTSYITTYANYGAKDFETVNGKLISVVNSRQAVAMTDMWARLIQAGGAPGWENYNWYKASADFGAGKAAMLYDADNAGYYQNYPGESEESGNIAWVKAPLPEGANTETSNLWTWGLAMNNSSNHKAATWLFLQYFTGKEYALWAIQNFKVVDPARKSILESREFQKVLRNSGGYEEVLRETINNAEIQFTPHPYFFEVASEWAVTLQNIVNGKYESTQEGMDELKIKFDNIAKGIYVQ